MESATSTSDDVLLMVEMKREKQSKSLATPKIVLEGGVAVVKLKS